MSLARQRAASLPIAHKSCSQRIHLPLDKSQLVPNSTIFQSVLKVVHCPSTFLLRELSDKLVIVFIGRRVEDDNRLFVVRDTKDDVGEFLAGLELRVFLETFGVLGYSFRETQTGKRIRDQGGWEEAIAGNATRRSGGWSG